MDTKAAIEEAISWSEQGNNARAIGILGRVVIKEPRNEEAWLLISGLVVDQDRAVECLERVLRINPNNIPARMALEKINAKEIVAGTLESPSDLDSFDLPESETIDSHGADIDSDQPDRMDDFDLPSSPLIKESETPDTDVGPSLQETQLETFSSETTGADTEEEPPLSLEFESPPEVTLETTLESQEPIEGANLDEDQVEETLEWLDTPPPWDTSDSSDTELPDDETLDWLDSLPSVDLPEDNITEKFEPTPASELPDWLSETGSMLKEEDDTDDLLPAELASELPDWLSKPSFLEENDATETEAPATSGPEISDLLSEQGKDFSFDFDDTETSSPSNGEGEQSWYDEPDTLTSPRFDQMGTPGIATDVETFDSSDEDSQSPDPLSELRELHDAGDRKSARGSKGFFRNMTKTQRNIIISLASLTIIVFIVAAFFILKLSGAF